MLLLTSAFFQLFFVLITHLVSKITNELYFSAVLVLGYLVTAFAQVLLLIFLAQLVVALLWKWGADPDMHAIPLITAFGDMTGTSLLVGLFFALEGMSENAVRVTDGVANSTLPIRNCIAF